MRLPIIIALSITALATTASAQGSGAFVVSETGRSYARLTDAVAASIELLHCASLVHDDLPCFDNAALRRGVHEHFRDALRYSCAVGGTHWQDLGGGKNLPGPAPTLFFAPAQSAKRSAAPPQGWGAAELQRRIADSWRGSACR